MVFLTSATLVVSVWLFAPKLACGRTDEEKLINNKAEETGMFLPLCFQVHKR
ncbi:MAG: hypothetical protein IJB11_05520 [Oscillospiraceae bacterium]|nr:hypothetical protein [Oscillospiraceae bacterium]